MYGLQHEIRFINTDDYGIDNTDKLYGFVCGILSGDFDISSIYIDGLKKMIKKHDGDLERLLTSFDELFSDINAHMVISGSEEPPEFLKKYIEE
jgi:hypothetical protein